MVRSNWKFHREIQQLTFETEDKKKGTNSTLFISESMLCKIWDFVTITSQK